ncbi:MAG: hypothetical protein LAT84_11800 [Balneolia bacterium]|nr:hypothetical protein [Balneolia bacterium]
MRLKSIILKLTAVIFLLYSGLLVQESVAQTPDEGSVLHELVVKVIDGEWRVVHKDDPTKSTVTVKRNDRISWTAEGSIISMQFDELFGGNSFVVEDGETFQRPVAPGARLGEFTYSVFIHEAMVFARGESPPRIIVVRD